MTALQLFEQIIQTKPKSATAWLGKAQSLDKLAERMKSNDWLDKAISAYLTLIDFEDRLDDDFLKNVSTRCIEAMRFKGTISMFF